MVVKTDNSWADHWAVYSVAWLVTLSVDHLAVYWAGLMDGLSVGHWVVSLAVYLVF